jgi:hypothetical protein
MLGTAVRSEVESTSAASSAASDAWHEFKGEPFEDGAFGSLSLAMLVPKYTGSSAGCTLVQLASATAHIKVHHTRIVTTSN